MHRTSQSLQFFQLNEFVARITQSNLAFESRAKRHRPNRTTASKLSTRTTNHAKYAPTAISCEGITTAQAVLLAVSASKGLQLALPASSAMTPESCSFCTERTGCSTCATRSICNVCRSYSTCAIWSVCDVCRSCSTCCHCNGVGLQGMQMLSALSAVAAMSAVQHCANCRYCLPFELFGSP